MLLTKFNLFIAAICFTVLTIILIGFVLKRMKQPYIIGYILAGVFLGEYGLGLIEDSEAIHEMGEIGIILLLFFVGMEVSLPAYKTQWKVALLGTVMQIIMSLGVMLLIGWFLDWKISRSIVLGFVIALSSSAVIIKVLQDKNLISSRLGKNILSILLTQDILIVPILIITSFLGGEEASIGSVGLMVLGVGIFVGLLALVYAKTTFKFPFAKTLENDHELQVFAAIILCFGCALLAILFGLSPALGAFVGGMIMHARKTTDWLHRTLDSFRVIFVSVFFISVGLQIDLGFIRDNISIILVGISAVYFINHLLNMLVLRVFSSPWKEAFMGGAYLAQIGELSFLISSSAYGLGIIGIFAFNFTICLISITLIISPIWILICEKLSGSK